MIAAIGPEELVDVSVASTVGIVALLVFIRALWTPGWPTKDWRPGIFFLTLFLLETAIFVVLICAVEH